MRTEEVTPAKRGRVIGCLSIICLMLDALFFKCVSELPFDRKSLFLSALIIIWGIILISAIICESLAILFICSDISNHIPNIEISFNYFTKVIILMKSLVMLFVHYRIFQLGIIYNHIVFLALLIANYLTFILLSIRINKSNIRNREDSRESEYEPLKAQGILNEKLDAANTPYMMARQVPS